MLTSEIREDLEKQQYRIVGSHSAVKICNWTKQMIRGKGGCYKFKFYGIRSHQCLQMTTALSCANRCIFCWRGYKAPVFKEWKGNVDSPEAILRGCLEAQQKLLVGFKGSDNANKKCLEESKTVKHVALSLTGEPIIYPQINQLIDMFHKEKISTFLVTNAQYPEEIKNLRPITQFYLSLDAPTKGLLKKIDKPLFSDYWERLLKSLDYTAKKKQRTCVRLTIINGLNDCYPEKYADLIQRGNFDFIEVKAYMHVGESRLRLKKEDMPLHEEIVQFAKSLVPFLEEYRIVSEHIPSRVVMLAKKKFYKDKKWHTWIDFEKFFEQVESGKDFLGKDFSSEDYLKKTPEVGLSGKGTLDIVPEALKEKLVRERLGK